MRALLLAMLLSGGFAVAAPARAVVLVRAPELSATQKARLLEAGRAALGARTSFAVEAVPPTISGPTQPPCHSEACLMAAAREAGAELALILDASLPELLFELRASFVDVGSGKVSTRVARGGSPDQPNDGVDLLLDAVLPEWARKGWASVAIVAPPDSVVKVDGRRVGLTPLPGPLSLAAGAHEIDVVFPSGQGELWRRKLVEGERLRLDASPSAAFDPPGTRSNASALRPLSFGLWSAGAVAIAASLVAGGLARGAEDDLAGCVGASRDCLKFDQAQAVHRRADDYARAGNVLLIGGAVLGASGAGLFVFDLAGSGR